MPPLSIFQCNVLVNLQLFTLLNYLQNKIIDSPCVLLSLTTIILSIGPVPFSGGGAVIKWVEIRSTAIAGAGSRRPVVFPV